MSKVLCVFDFKICISDGRERGEGRKANSKTYHTERLCCRTFDNSNTSWFPLGSCYLSVAASDDAVAEFAADHGDVTGEESLVHGRCLARRRRVRNLF